MTENDPKVGYLTFKDRPREKKGGPGMVTGPAFALLQELQIYSKYQNVNSPALRTASTLLA